jgi:hypothetical protein
MGSYLSLSIYIYMMVWKILPIVKLGIVIDMFGNCEIRGVWLIKYLEN